MSSARPSKYLIELCDVAAQQPEEPFGVAVRMGSTNSKYKIAASKVIHSIVTFSPAQDSMAVEVLHELSKVTGMGFLVNPVVCRTSPFDCATWAKEVMDFLSTKFTEEQRSVELKPIVHLASEMLSHLIATRNPGGKKTPQETIHPTPNIPRLREIKALMEEVQTKRSQSALKELILRRDGNTCPFTGAPFVNVGHGIAVTQCAHIIPFSFHDKPLTLGALERFTGRGLAEEVKENFNLPCNAFNIEPNAHDSFDKLAWGIEAVGEGDECKYFFRKVRPDEIAYTINLAEGQEIIFHRGTPEGKVINRPNPEYCNIKLALARVLHACGAADIIDEMYGDDDEAIVTQPVYFGGPFVSDDVLLRRLDDRLFVGCQDVIENNTLEEDQISNTCL